MDIIVLGPGCPRCFEVQRRTSNALAVLKLEADIKKVSDVKKFLEYGIISTPGLVINGKVKCSGRIPSVEEIKVWVAEEK